MTTAVEGSVPTVDARRITLRGSVQGLGIRPAIARLARAEGLYGQVRNEMAGVVIDVSGNPDSLERFIDEIPCHLPVGAVVGEITSVCQTGPDASFRITPSNDAGPTRTFVPLDRVVCQPCLADVRTAANRRHGYPFTSCTLCGPRYSILRSMPYDRQRTSMSTFQMCESCRREYEDPSDRRFHSQTNCCPACGPRLWSTDRSGMREVSGDAAMQAAIEAILDGRIVAIKGIGGYQLVCDATNEAAVVRLRLRKHRTSKPLAVMVIDVDAAEQLARLSQRERETICGSGGPIVIARGHTSSILAPAVNSGLGNIGLMLPTSPLHFLFLDAVGIPLVVTSGNVDGEPIEYREDEVEKRLANVADRYLHHDREIIRPIDDSVVRVIADRVVTIRAGRGIAPLPLDIRKSTPTISVGAQQKVAIALFNRHQSILGPHIGDLDSIASRQRFVDQTTALCRLYDCEANVIVHDSHPDYFTSQFHSARYDRTIHRESIQHHHAHVVSGMVQQGWLDKRVLGFAFDGTGLGTDNTIWGGEILLATCDEFDRVGHLRPFSLAGGQAAIRDPSRVAVALIQDTYGTESGPALDIAGIETSYRKSITALLHSPRLSRVTTSVGRLFDGVATIVLDERRYSYQGEPAMRLESVCDLADQHSYEISLSKESPRQLDWRPMIRQLLDDKQRGLASGKMAMRFHRGLARAVVGVIEQYFNLPIVLSGGVFQNRVLVELIVDLIPGDRCVGLPGAIPPGDGGLAAGQLAVAQHAIATEETRPCV